MKIAIVQTDSFAGDIEKNVEKHLSFITSAAKKNADIVVFPELSITGYEPTKAAKLAAFPINEQFNRLQQAANQTQMTICIGLPTPTEDAPCISMGIFQPEQSPLTYSKMLLDPDECPFFVNGKEQLILEIKNATLAPAICYESLQIEHVEAAIQQGATIYLASVAIPQRSIQKAQEHYAQIAKKYKMTVALSNCIGEHDNFTGGGRSAIWDKTGKQVATLNGTEEDILIYNISK